MFFYFIKILLLGSLVFSLNEPIAYFQVYQPPKTQTNCINLNGIHQEQSSLFFSLKLNNNDERLLYFRSLDNFEVQAARYLIAHEMSLGNGCEDITCTLKLTLNYMEKCVNNLLPISICQKVQQISHIDDIPKRSTNNISKNRMQSLLYDFNYISRSDYDFSKRLDLLEKPIPIHQPFLILTYDLWDQDCSFIHQALALIAQKEPHIKLTNDTALMHTANLVVFDGVFSYIHSVKLGKLYYNRPVGQLFMLVSIEAPHISFDLYFDLKVIGEPEGRADLLLSPASNQFETLLTKFQSFQKEKQPTENQNKHLNIQSQNKSKKDISEGDDEVTNEDSKEDSKEEEEEEGEDNVVEHGVVAFVSSRCIEHRDQWVKALDFELRKRNIAIDSLGKCDITSKHVSIEDGNVGHQSKKKKEQSFKLPPRNKQIEESYLEIGIKTHLFTSINILRFNRLSQHYHSSNSLLLPRTH